ncbi:hypothetical protein [Aestuariivirga sp.]|uniref:hypothetical protein n=1 Tax=Aestuariivirga sp. TaxID=2650926 RepID=UPI00391D38F1
MQQAPRDALLVLVGVTAGRAERRHLRDVLESRHTFTVYLPALPFRLGLRACSRFLIRYLRTRILARGHQAVHVLAYIGGAYAMRLAAPSLGEFPLGRIVFVRSPLQELVPRYAVKRWSAALVWLTQGKATVDMAREDIMRLPLPAVGTERGLIVEMLPSAMARMLGLTPEAVPNTAWEHSTLLPGATDATQLEVSHDEAYSDPELIDQAHAFLTTGRFRREGGPDAGAR